MESIKICIFDLDDTLVEGDTFRHVVMSCLLKSPTLSLLLVKRLLRLVTRGEFAETAHRLVSEHWDPKKICDDALNRVDPEIHQDVGRRKASGSLVILISASPDDYVRIIGERLGFDHARGSFWGDDESYTHLHSQGKVSYLMDKYPSPPYEWAYAVSDSESDMPLLNMCETSLLYCAHK